MKKRIFSTLIIGIAVFISFKAYSYLNAPSNFIDQAFVQLRGGAGSEISETIELKSGGQYTVIMEHSCCSGAGFDAVAIRTSTGVEYSSEENYCGLEGFYGVVVSQGFGSFEELGEYLLSNGYKKH